MYSIPPLKSLFLVCLLFGFAEANAAQSSPAGKDALENNRRILFLGDSITYAGTYVTYFDTWLTLAHPDRQYEVLNLGLPSETVSGLSEDGHADGAFPRPDLDERLDRVLSASEPNLVIACYGINCGIYQHFNDERFLAYKQGIKRLRAAVLERGSEIVFVTPPTYDSHGDTDDVDYDAVLAEYSTWLLSRRDEGWFVVDLHAKMREEIKKRRQEDPAFTFQTDRVHPDNEGHWFIARQLIAFFGGRKATEAHTPEEMERGLTTGDPIIAPVGQRMIVLRNAWLTQTGHERPGIPEGLPLPEAQKRARKITGEIETLLAPAPPLIGEREK